jgi:hypothetical protein
MLTAVSRLPLWRIIKYLAVFHMPKKIMLLRLHLSLSNDKHVYRSSQSLRSTDLADRRIVNKRSRVLTTVEIK